MKKEEIHLGDINRWLIGQTTWEFMIEVVIRTVLIYIFLLLIVRLMGKRMSGQITLTEMAVMITLGAIVSPVMQLPDRGILFGVLALICALIFQRQFNLWTVKNHRAEEITQGKLSMLVKDGKIVVEELNKTYITHQQLYALLRQKNIYNLGKVKRAYLEGCGAFSVFVEEDDKPGLPIYPEFDQSIKQSQNKLDGSVKACCNCGHVQEGARENIQCTNCGATDWTHTYHTRENELQTN
ncbi:DUF421 domain-containing protein [Telluribacter sp. SYSU D00476]|uniref:DUF421 domain-containing protein n=1 Tax=Telluribacter sp. SYSU D00476 TaxID=2811430 RepID=UPI001FF6B895|nr:YetF domain-containing protein [Telluribacter sp. SYSU D00476]